MKINRNNLYIRCGTIEHEEVIKERPLTKVELFDGTEMIIGGKHSSTLYSDNVSFKTILVLKTPFGYMPLKNIKSKIDLLKLKNYVTDNLVWIQEYEEYYRIIGCSYKNEEEIIVCQQRLCKKL